MSFNPSNLKNYPLYKLFWETPEPQAGEEDDGLSHRGLAQVNPEGAERLKEFALDHELDGTSSPDDAKKIDAAERDLMIHLLEHEDYGPAFGPQARPKLYEDFGIDVDAIHPTPIIHRPQKAGTIDLPGRVSQYSAAQLGNAKADQLPQAMKTEFAQLAGNSSGEDKGKLAVALLRDYAQALWSRGETAHTENIGHELLNTFESFGPEAKALGSKDFSGAGWSIAQSLVLGANPSDFDVNFPEARLDTKTTSLSMNGAMADSMKYIDQIRAAQGKPTGAEKLELGSPLGWMIGEQNGHKKRGNLTESKAFSTSGLNWGVVMFPGNSQIKDLAPKSDFDMAIDCIDAFGNMITARPDHGDSIDVFDKDGNKLQMEPVIHNNDAGEPASWSAKFTNAAGDEVPASEVTGRIKNAQGQYKGDGETNGSMNMWWWGFCDRNTAQRLYKSKFKIPQLDRDVIKIKAGDQTIEVPKEAAQKIIDADVPDLAAGDSFTGFRFDNEPQYVVLKNGEQIQGYVEGLDLQAGPGGRRLQGDLIAIHDAPGRPMLGTIQVGSKHVDVKNIDRIEKGEDGEVTVFTKEGWPKEVSGELKTDVPWDKAEEVDGKTVLAQDKDYPIRGAFTVKTASGNKTYTASEISMIAGETTKDMRISQFTTWVSNNEGMYAIDASPKEVVGNGPRWVNRVDVREETGEERPSFIPEGDLTGIQGPLERQDGDKMLYVRALYAHNADSDAKSSQFEGWVQVNSNGRIINEGFTKGQPDFGWGASGPLDWTAKSSFNEFVDPDVRLALFVNGVSNLDDAEAKRLNLPSDWKSYQTPQD